MQPAAPFELQTFSRSRELVIDVVRLGSTKHHVPILFEVDITEAREAIRRYRRRTGSPLSFTGWLVRCIAQAISENKKMHGLRLGRHKLVLFEQIDVLVTVQKPVGDELIPLPFVVRNANDKSILQINEEIQTAKREVASNTTMTLGSNPWYAKLYPRIPGTIRGMIGRAMLRDPFAIKRFTGTVGVSSIGMVGNFAGWAIPVGPLPIQFAIGGVSKKPTLLDGKLENRDVLCVSFVFDHDVVDGGPAAAFTSRLAELLQSAFGVSELDDPHDSVPSRSLKGLAGNWAARVSRSGARMFAQQEGKSACTGRQRSTTTGSTPTRTTGRNQTQ